MNEARRALRSAAARRKSCLPPRLSTRMAATRIRVRLNGYEQPFKLIRVLIYQLPASGSYLRPVEH